MGRNYVRPFKLTACLACFVVSCVPCLSQRGWTLPDDDWIFRTLLNLKDSGLVGKSPDGLFRGLPARVEVAGYLAHIHDELNHRVEEMELDLRLINRRPITFNEIVRQAQPIKEKAQLFSTHDKDISELRRMVEIFRPELASIGRDADAISDGLVRALTKAVEILKRFQFADERRELPFNDVPAGHWAYDALEAGRNGHLLFGYPDELFQGGNALTRYELAGAINAFYQEVRQQAIKIHDQYSWRFSFPSRPAPPSLAEMARSLARFNWVLKHRRALIEFLSMF